MTPRSRRRDRNRPDAETSHPQLQDGLLLSLRLPRSTVAFQRESGLTWAEIARRVGTPDLNVRRWREGVRPHWRRLAALLALAEDLRLARLLTGGTVREETRGETAFPGIPPDHRSPGRKPADWRRS